MGVSSHFHHIMVPASRNLYAGKSFGNYMLRNSDGHHWFLREGGGGGGGNLAKCYGIILRFKTMVSRAGDGDSGNIDLSTQRRARQAKA